jgi:hypothetical protein
MDMHSKIATKVDRSKLKSSAAPKEVLNKSFDRLRTNGKCLIPFVVSLSNHERNQLVQAFPNH